VPVSAGVFTMPVVPLAEPLPPESCTPVQVLRPWIAPTCSAFEGRLTPLDDKVHVMQTLTLVLTCGL
jgi:hypothetical protein